MKIEVRVREKGLYGSFTVSDRGVKEILEQALPRLSARMNQLGYDSLFLVSAEPAERISRSLAPKIEKGVDSLLDVIV